jgi:hypothetical protein
MHLTRRASACVAATCAAVAAASFAPAAMAQAPTGGDLFVATTSAGSLTPTGGDTYRLVLRDPARDVTAFSDRPERRTSTERVRAFVRDWDARGFAADPPNAALVIDGAPASRDVAVLEISKPRLARNGALSFTAKRVGSGVGGELSGLASRADARVSRGFGRASLFVDASAANEHKLAINVSGLPAGGLSMLQFGTERVDPFPSDASSHPIYVAQAGGELTLATNAIVMSAGAAPLTANLVIGVSSITPGPITGTLVLPAGATMTVAVDGGAPVTLPAGPFSLPVG